MVQRTYYPPADAPDEPAWAAQPEDVHTLRHGYNLADLDRLTKRAIWRVWGVHLDYRTRYDLAWSAITEHLYASAEPPSPSDLVFAGQDEIANHVRDQMRHHGRDKTNDGEIRRFFATYWELSIRHAPAPERRVVERTALWQIWPTLTEAQRRALLALAAHGTHQAAAESLGITVKTFRQHVGNARRRFLELWHEHEQPSRFWGTDRLVHRGVRTEASYQKAAKAIRHRDHTRTEVIERRRTEPVHGKASTYGNRGCRCDLCSAAVREESTARRRKAGAAVRRFITVSELEEAHRRNEAGETWTAIAKDLGFADSYLRRLRRGEAKPIPDPPGEKADDHLTTREDQAHA